MTLIPPVFTLFYNCVSKVYQRVFLGYSQTDGSIFNIHLNELKIGFVVIVPLFRGGGSWADPEGVGGAGGLEYPWKITKLWGFFAILVRIH